MYPEQEYSDGMGVQMGQNGKRLSGGSGFILPDFFMPRLVVVVKKQEFEADLLKIGPKTMKSQG